MEELSLIDVLCNVVVLEQIMKFLNIRDVVALMRTCRTLYKYLNSNQIWLCLHRIHFNKKPSQIYKQSYLDANTCGHEARIGNEWFICTNAPVYSITICDICRHYVKICRYCINRDGFTRMFCVQCEMFCYVCRLCSVANPEVNIVDRMRICNTCHNFKCIRHYVGAMQCCMECMIEHPEIIEENLVSDDESF